jgi:cellulose 1,4-beta-cellobiosidase
LSWNASTGATNYNVKRSTTSGGGYVTIASPATMNYTDTAVTNGTTYYYAVSAVNSQGESTNSSWVSATPTVSAASQTNYFNFSPTFLANGVGPSNPANGAVTINGSSLTAGNVIVCDVLVSNTSGTSGDNWGAVNLNQGGFMGVTGARFGVLVRTGTGNNQCQVYTNGVAGAVFPGSSEVHSNRLRITLYVAATGSTSNMGWLAQLDQGLTGSFTTSLSGTNLTFPGNNISLTFSAYQAAVSFVQYPIPVNTNAPTLVWQANGALIQFSWPADHIGWTLQMQTNPLNVGLGANWVTVPGSTITNQFILTPNPANGTVFLRLAYP